MFDNIGRKIKNLAVITCVLEIIASIIIGIILIESGDDDAIIGITTILAGPFAAWISSFFVYGFGQLIENSDILVAMHSSDSAKHNSAEEDTEEDTGFITQNLREITKNNPTAAKCNPPAATNNASNLNKNIECNEWECSCGNKNNTIICKCGNTILDCTVWKCDCGNVWYNNTTICSCGRSIFDKLPVEFSDNLCPNCGKHLGEKTKNFCTYCGYKF